MLTNTLLLYVTQEAWARARERLVAGRAHADQDDRYLIPRWREETEQRRTTASEVRRWPPRLRH
ncbi:MAG TPA: hypothetical protein VKZ87_06900 [Ferrovibrio sp.]|jgi:hypothetical protein|uniref:hypothetical protein n=1 Tax=Ferrovibrio sp. TaxID=1917215 RepID=UPI002B4AC397|nr:hypothetical protein [Ferrovibrio sp.]HLT77097.1 hypothetical protein [Ferrovibrio sp.]